MENTQFSSSAIMYSERSTTKIGGTQLNKYRSLLFFNIKQYIENKLETITGYTTGVGYSILNANVTLTSSDGATSGNIYAFMLPLGSSADESASWYKPSEIAGSTWEDGGTVEPLAEFISPIGTWRNNDLSFDITPFVNIWLSSPQNPMGIMLTTDETTDTVLEFHSQQAQSPLLGAAAQTNVVFLGAGATNSINTEGVLVKIEPFSSYLTVESADSNPTSARRWSAFNASVSVGNTFSMFLPDLGGTASAYTLIDKRSSVNGVQMVISGSSAGISTSTHTAAEFTCVGTVPVGSGIVEFSAPSTSLVTDLSTLNPNDTVIFEYTPTITPNNATSYTVDFYSDERTKNNRLRLYTKEATATENRSGLATEIKRNNIRPRLSLSLAF